MTFRDRPVRVAILAALTMLAVVKSATALEPAEPRPADAPAIRVCLADQKPTRGEPNPCMETIAKACMTEVGNDYDSTTRDCYRRGTAAWDVILNEEYRALRETMKAARFAVLRDQQRAWLKNKTAKCDGIYAQFQGTMAHPLMAKCENREIAQRALILMKRPRR